MGILKNLFGTLFGKKEKKYEKNGGLVPQTDFIGWGLAPNLDTENDTLIVSVDKENNRNIVGGENIINSSSDINEIQAKQGIHFRCDSFPSPISKITNDQNVIQHSSSVKEESSKKRKRGVIGLKTKAEIKNYLITNGSLDPITCKQKFNVKSLQNFIWELRKDGFNFKTEKVGFKNKNGEIAETTNYILITENQNGTN